MLCHEPSKKPNFHSFPEQEDLEVAPEPTLTTTLERELSSVLVSDAPHQAHL